MVDIKSGASYAPSAKATAVVAPGEFLFAVAFLDHGHIYGQTNGLRDAGATLKYVYDTDSVRRKAFCKRYPDVTPVQNFETILTDPEIKLVASAAIPNQRAAIGAQVLAAGKDYFTDKSPFTTLDQLHEIRQLVAVTGQKYMVYYSERLHNEAAWRAGELIAEGAVGRVVQVLNLAPHRLAKATRPDWFFNKQQYGGILTDIGSHQIEQFLTYASCDDATINHARVCNFNNPDKPGLEDFGEVSLTGVSANGEQGASFYARVDWFTPEGLSTWGDGRTFIVGTEGTLELRKYIDVARHAPASRLFVVDRQQETEIDCLNSTGFPFFGELIKDVLQRSEHAMTQEHAFKAAELSLLAQNYAENGKIERQNSV